MVIRAQSNSRGPCAPAPVDSRCHARGRRGGDQRIGPPLACDGGERVAAPDGQHMEHVLGFQPRPQVLGLTRCLVRGEPGEGHTRPDRPADHGQGLPWLGGELHLTGDARRPAPVLVRRPGQRQVELPPVTVPGRPCLMRRQAADIVRKASST